MSDPAAGWKIGAEVTVAARTWPGINKPGGHGKIIRVHYSSLGVVDSLDVKYTLGKRIDKELDPDLVELHEQLERGKRRRKCREFFVSECHEGDCMPMPRFGVKCKGECQPQLTVATAFTSRTRRKKMWSEAQTELQPQAVERNGTERLDSGPIAIQWKETSSPTNDKGSVECTLEHPIPKFVVTRQLSTPEIGGEGGRCTSARKPPVQTDGDSCRYSATESRKKRLPHLRKRRCRDDPCDGPRETTSGDDVPRAVSDPRVNEGRYIDFSRLFSKTIMQNDAALKEGYLLECINESARKECEPFSVKEFRLLAARLTAEDKVMMSGDCFYTI